MKLHLLFIVVFNSSVESFAPRPHCAKRTTILHSQNPFGGYNPGSAAPEPTPAPTPQEAGGDRDGEEASLKGNRWSKFAPDASLSTEDFRSQLKENMKADLERRRREDPNRGNQPAKNYLDSL